MKPTAIEIRRVAPGRWYYVLPGWGEPPLSAGGGTGPFPDARHALNAAVYKIDGRTPDGGTHTVAAALAAMPLEPSPFGALDGGEADSPVFYFTAGRVKRTFAENGPEKAKRAAPLLAPVEAGGRQLDLIDAIGAAAGSGLP